MKNLLVVDLQKEFAAPEYDKVLDYVRNAKEYDKVYGTLYKNTPETSFVQRMGYTKCMNAGPESLDYQPDELIVKTGYGLAELELEKDAEYDIVGCCTGACVMAVAYQLWDAGIPFRILTDYCYSTSGPDYHEAAVKLLRSNFGSTSVI